MRITQKLSSGVIVRQDFTTASRFVFFDSGNDDWRYATHGGTMFVVQYRGRLFGLTCGHILQDFEWKQLQVTDAKFGKNLANIRAVYNPSSPKNEAIDTDIVDVAIIEFTEDIDTKFFTDAAYIIDENKIAKSYHHDNFLVHGSLK